MYVVVSMKGGKIAWSDVKVYDSKEKADYRKGLLKRMQPKREYQILQFTKYKLAA